MCVKVISGLISVCSDVAKIDAKYGRCITEWRIIWNVHHSVRLLFARYGIVIRLKHICYVVFKPYYYLCV
jgi:hypothetical protein